MTNKLWLIGAGVMSMDYVKVLNALNIDYIVIGRGVNSAEKFKNITGKEVITGGLEKFLNTKLEPADYAIVSVGVEQLFLTTNQLLNYGIKNILVEKPGAMLLSEIKKIKKNADKLKANVYIAYNRRFYSSVLKAKEIIVADGGVKSFNFEFTEWKHTIDDLEKADGVKENWFIANSSHVSDLAFYLGGKPTKISAFHSGQNKIKWHPASAVFSGAGITETEALFSYQANWLAPGRWVVEILTNAHRLIFRPMEKLHLQKLKSVAIEPVEIDDKLDIDYKPGLYKQTEMFVTGKNNNFCTVAEQCEMFKIYNIIAGYNS